MDYLVSVQFFLVRESLIAKLKIKKEYRDGFMHKNAKIIQHMTKNWKVTVNIFINLSFKHENYSNQKR